MPLDQLLLFMAAGWLLNMTPGPDVLYIVSHSLRHGVRAGVVAGLGITAGCFVHIAAAAAGVSALLATSAMAFTALKWIGAAYLMWVGIKLLVSQGGLGPLANAEFTGAAVPHWRVIFRGGFWTNVLNPKVAIFFLAFVPQFISPDVDNKALAFVLLGVLFNVNAIPVNVAWAWMAGWMAQRQAVQRRLHWLDRVAGALFIGFGLKLALSDNPHT